MERAKLGGPGSLGAQAVRKCLFSECLQDISYTRVIKEKEEETLFT